MTNTENIEQTIVKDIKKLEDDIQLVIFMETEDIDYQDLMIMMDDLSMLTYYIRVDEVSTLNRYLDEKGIPVNMLRDFTFY